MTGSFEYFVPIHIAVELTAQCNLRCTHCYNDFTDAAPGLDPEELISILREWKAHGLLGVELTGGEPLLYRGFWEVLEFCSLNFQRIALLTNGTLVSLNVAERLSDFKDQLIVSVSLDGSCPEVHEKIRGKGSFEGTQKAIRYLADRGIRVRAAMSATPESIYDLEETVLLAKSLGAEHFSWAPIAPFGRAQEDAWTWRPEEALTIHELEKRVMETYEGFVTVIPREAMGLLEKLGNCGAGYKNLAISPSGKVRPCLFQPETESIGDLRTESLDELFRKPILGLLANLKGPSEEVCGGCRYWGFCGACAVRALTAIEREGRLCAWGKTQKISRWLSRFEDYPFDPDEPVFQ